MIFWKKKRMSMVMPVDNNAIPAKRIEDLPESRRLLGMVSKKPYDPRAEVPDVLVRKLHEIAMIVGMNTAIGYEIDDMRDVEGFLENLDILRDRVRELCIHS